MGAGRTIRQSRLNANLTQEDVAKQAGVTREWLSLVERDGIKQPGWDNLVGVARVLGLQPEAVLAEAGYRVDVPPPEERDLNQMLAELERMVEEIKRVIKLAHSSNPPKKVHAGEEAGESRPTRELAARPRPGRRGQLVDSVA